MRGLFDHHQLGAQPDRHVLLRRSGQASSSRPAITATGTPSTSSACRSSSTRSGSVCSAAPIPSRPALLDARNRRRSSAATSAGTTFARRPADRDRAVVDHFLALGAQHRFADAQRVQSLARTRTRPVRNTAASGRRPARRPGRRPGRPDRRMSGRAAPPARLGQIRGHRGASPRRAPVASTPPRRRVRRIRTAREVDGNGAKAVGCATGPGSARSPPWSRCNRAAAARCPSAAGGGGIRCQARPPAPIDAGQVGVGRSATSSRQLIRAVGVIRRQPDHGAAAGLDDHRARRRRRRPGRCSPPRSTGMVVGTIPGLPFCAAKTVRPPVTGIST